MGAAPERVEGKRGSREGARGFIRLGSTNRVGNPRENGIDAAPVRVPGDYATGKKKGKRDGTLPSGPRLSVREES